MGEEKHPAVPIGSFPEGSDRSFHRYHTATFRKGWLRSALVGLVIALLSIGLSRIGLMQSFELRTVDARFRLRGVRPVSSPLAVVFIGDDSIDEFGRWPWSWDLHALIIDVLSRAGARQILFDVFFVDSPGKIEEQVLAEMTRQAGNVYFCSFFDFFTSPEGATPLLGGEGLIEPVVALAPAAAGIGHCNAEPDMDGITRRVPLVVDHGGEAYPALLMKAALDRLGADLEDVSFSEEGLVVVKPEGRPPIQIPVDREGRVAINYVGGLESIPALSFRQVLQADRYPDTAAVDLELFRDRTVLVGVTFTGNTDMRPTPFDATYPMIGIQAMTLDNILSEEFISRPPGPVFYLGWIVLTVLVGGIAFAFRPQLSLVFSMLAGGLYLGGALAAFVYASWQIEIVGPLSGFLMVYLVVTTLQYIETRQQKMRYLERMKYLGHLVESASEAIISFDLKGNIVSWNNGAREIYGYGEKDVIDRRWDFMVAPEEREKVNDLMRSATMGEDAAHRETTFIDSGGQPIPVDVLFSPIRDSRGDLVGLSAISEDLREKKKMIEMLVQSEKLAEIGRMGSGIVHEIKNPLTSIMMMSGIIYSQEDLPPKTKKYADIIEKESQRILRLSQNILSFARPKKPEMKETALNQAMEDTLELVEYELKKSKVKVRREMDDDAPVFLGDSEKVKQVFLNIIMNAVHAMDEGGEIVVRTFAKGHAPPPGSGNAGWESRAVGEAAAGTEVMVEIEDNGPGMPVEVLDHIFEPFFSTKGEGKGTGLGLYISRNIILEHQGSMKVSSRPGEGTMFTITFPSAAGDKR